MKNREISLNRFFLLWVVAVTALCLTWAAFAGPQGDPVRCKKLQAIGARLQEELEKLQARLDNPDFPECLGPGVTVCKAQIRAKQSQIEANRRVTKLACADLPTPTPTPTPEPTPNESPLCKKLKAVGERLQEQLEKLRDKLDSEECQGPARTICQTRIRAKQTEIEANLRQTRIACGAPTPKPTPAPTPSFWIPVGPAPLDASGFGVAGGVSGLVWTIAVSPNFDRHGTAAMYIGINGGGVWRSTDFLKPAPHWTPLTDHFPASFPLARKVGLQNIGALAVDPNNPWIIYAGTGDPDMYMGNAYGNGLLKSTDGGNSWNLLSLGPNSSVPGFARILVDPTDHSGSTVYAATGFGPNSFLRGIFKSEDGGENWRNIQNGMPAALAVTDIDYSISGNNLTLFAGVNDLTGRNTGVNGIWQSTNGGESWSQMFLVPLIDLKGQPPRTSAIGLIKFAVDHSLGAPHGAFAAVSNSATSDLMNIYKLKQGLWVPTGSGINGIVSTWGALAIGMSGSGGVYVGMGNASQDGIYQSTDGGTTWSSIFIGANGVRPHHDQRSWASFGDLMFEGNDGGICRFTPLPNQRAGPGSWESLNTGSLQTILANGLGLHPQYPNVMLEGSQDNGVGRRNSSGGWHYVTGDDDGRCQFDPHDARFAYRTGVSNYDFFFRSDDGGTTWTGGKSVPTGAQAYAPFAFHPTNAGRIAMGTDQLYETRDRADHWKAISGQRGGAGSSVTAIAYGEGDTIYAAFGRQLVKTPNDGGDGTDGNWPVLNEGNDWNGKIISIAVDRHAANRVYLATENGAIWQSRNSGATWTNITTDFPSPPLAISSLALRSDTAASEPMLFVGTSVGVYSSAGREENRHWERLGTDLPDVNVTDLRFHDTTKYLAASTYGRGLFAAYMHFRTDVGPGSTSLRNSVFSFAKDLDGRISLNQAEFGRSFSGWFELQGGGLTDRPPAATAVRSSVFVFIKGLDRRLYLNQAEFGHPFSGWFELQGDGRTNSRPSAATIGDTVFVFMTGLDGHIFLNQADFGHAFGNWFEVQGHGLSDAAPAAAALNRSLFVFIKGLDGRILLNQADFGHAFGDWFEVQGNGRTDAAPAAATLGNSLFVVIKGLDGRVYLNQAEFGHAFSGWFELQGGGVTDVAPSVVAVGKSLFVFIKGLDGQLYVNQAEFGHAFSGWFEVGGGLQ
jgi:photosystem II stability/assembly factor-like uncharacterized protein